MPNKEINKMNGLLLQNRPKDLTEEQFKKMWDNSAYLLEAFYKTIQNFRPKEKVSPTDFDCPNHYAKLVAEAASRDIVDKIIDLLPKSLTTK